MKFGGLQVPRGRARQGRAGVPALGARTRATGLRAFASSQLLPGVGPATAARLLDAHADGRSIRRRRSSDFRAAGRGAPSTGRHFAKLSAWCRRNAAGWPAELDLVCRWYAPHLERMHDDAADARRPTSCSSRRSPSSYPSRERFLTELTLDPPDATSDEAGVPLLDEDYLILSTIHSAKGQEWTSVFVLNAVDGCIPSDLGTGTHGRDRGGAPPALCRDDARQGSSASDRAAALLCACSNAATATATCTPRARASSRPPSSIASRAAPGRSRRPAPPRPQGRRPSRSISPRGCAGCGASCRLTASGLLRPIPTAILHTLDPHNHKNALR